MNAVPKKKLCWNCEGNVARSIDNCPYCGVYLHATEDVEEDSWNPPYKLTTLKTDQQDIPSPHYTAQEDTVETNLVEEETDLSPSPFNHDLKKDLLPLLLFLSASIFFVFGLILMLFSQNGVLTLQWNGNLWPLFLFGSAPLFFFGFHFFQKK